MLPFLKSIFDKMRTIFIISVSILFAFSCKKPVGFKKEEDFSFYKIDLVNSTHMGIGDTHTLNNKNIVEPMFILSQEEFNYYYCSQDSLEPGYITRPSCPYSETDFNKYMIHRIKPLSSNRGNLYWREIHKMFLYVNEKDKKLVLYRKERDIYRRGYSQGYHYTYFIRIPNKYKDYPLEHNIKVAKITY